MCIHKIRKGYFNMRKTTDINGLRSVAKMMLHLPMAETEFDFIVSHPVDRRTAFADVYIPFFLLPDFP